MKRTRKRNKNSFATKIMTASVLMAFRKKSMFSKLLCDKRKNKRKLRKIMSSSSSYRFKI